MILADTSDTLKPAVGQASSWIASTSHDLLLFLGAHAFALGVLVACIALLVSYYTQIRKFLSEVRVELVKCTWPWDPQQKGFKRYKELYDSTVVVSITTLMLAAFIAGWDFIISAFVRLIVSF